MARFRTRLYKTDRARDFDHEQDRYVRMRQIYETIDRQSYQWVVVLVAGVGFFLDGYTLFASNIALPMISYVYWRNDTSSLRFTCINMATLAGTVLGMALFGFLADKNGRKKMYGVELVLLITATLGVVMASTGANGSMDIFAWLIWWRIVVGIGVGADYPLSAVITSEFAPNSQRARMMATVFFMQPLGQIAGNVVSLIVVATSRTNSYADTADVVRIVDRMWRWVIGIGVVPGVIATLFRFAIPESPRYLLDIEDDPVKAEFDATALFSDTVSIRTTAETASANSIPLPALSLSRPSTDNPSSPSLSEYPLQPATLNSHWRLARSDIVHYFWTERNWRCLAGTAAAWLLLDFSFYGIGLSSPQSLARTWGSLNLHGPAPVWKTDDKSGANIFDMFMNTSVHALVILNVGSFTGSLLFIFFSPKLSGPIVQKFGFLALAALFIAMGVVFVTVHLNGPGAVILYVVGQFLFNFGPNVTTYTIPAEVFPTRYRATCHGISAAAGKIGSIAVQLFSHYYGFGSSESPRYGWVMIIFGACMIVGAVVTHFWVPSTKRGRFWGGEPETLEVLALGRQGMRSRYAHSARSSRALTDFCSSK